ncbi:hypothetical protein [Nocardia macrotermitis]|uniref:Uncharacterized protein n=1 Tax=Nocardia macrotermitis TaxID=2585198 RepID=A0A7K0CXM1_9NOCA|nr:hypothetical protein [Nocardia macrotermitis]MQY17682.1 hypothetical protein [Nocardia macrotermitis]
MTTITQLRSAPCQFGDGRVCGDHLGELTDPIARRILGVEHAPTCVRWLDAVAYLSAGLDDD